MECLLDLNTDTNPNSGTGQLPEPSPVTPDDLPDQDLIEKLASNNVAPSTKSVSHMATSRDLLLCSKVKDMKRSDAIQWLVFSRLALVNVNLKHQQLQLHVKKQDETIISLKDQLRRKRNFHELMDFTQKILKNILTPNLIRPVLYQVGFPAIEVRPEFHLPKIIFPAFFLLT